MDTTGMCQPCFNFCATCSNGINTGCLACKANAQLQADGTCRCNAGFVMDSNGSCQVCHNTCNTCSSTQINGCESCKALATL